MYENLKKEIVRLVLLLLLMVALGIISGQWFLSVLLVFISYMIWHLRQVYFLERWLLGLDDSLEERSTSIWRYVIETVQRYQKSGRKRKRRISRLLQRFNTTLELLPNAIIVTDTSGKIEWVNAASNKLLGVSRRNIGSFLAGVLPDEMNADSKTLQNGFLYELVSPINGSIELEVRVTAFGKDQLLVTAHDITALKKVESIRREFLANVSHELRTPLTVITGYLELLDSEDLPGEFLDGIRAASRQARRMQLLVSDLLMLSRLEMHESNPLIEEIVDIGKLIEGLRQDAIQLSDTANHRIKPEVEAEIKLRGNEAELASAFGNLIFNAVLHTPAGTRIIIGWHRKARSVEFSVSDNGPGIEPRHVARLTERFYRVDKARSREKGGTGLGLSISRHVLQRHGAEMTIESTVGKGTTFRCVFPVDRIVD